MKKIAKEDYNSVRYSFRIRVNAGLIPGLKQQGRSKQRRIFYREWARDLNCYEGTIRRIVKSKNYADYLRLGNENSGNSKNRSVTNKWLQRYGASMDLIEAKELKRLEDILPEELKKANQVQAETVRPKRYKTTIISIEEPSNISAALEFESYTVEVLND